jgi:PilX N-terminal
MRDPRSNETGFALVLALLSLLLLTFLGLTLATTTSTELQIANNYRWGQQALYNAEAGLELAKRFLQQNTAWQIFVPVARNTSEMSGAPTWTTTPTGPSGEANRSLENSDCDSYNTGFGAVLVVPGFTYPFQNVSTFFGETISGSFTLWVRRKVEVNADGTVQDAQVNDRLLVTAEGTAPYAYAGGTAAGYQTSFRKRAVRTLEVEVQRVDPSECENSFQGQAGLGALGSNYDPCNAVNATGIIGAVSEVNTGS